MKKLTILTITLLVLIGCKNNSEKETAIPEPVESTKTEAKKDCTSNVTFGDIEICLPKVQGITECYSHPKIKSRVNRFNDPENTILGYYIENEVYNNLDNLENISYDNYYQIYAANQAKNYTMTRSEMNQIMSMMTSGFLDKTMNEVNESTSFTEKDIKVTQPMLIEKYNLNKASSSIIILMKLADKEQDRTMAVSMNAVLIKKRIVFISHYLDYKDEKSLTRLKENTANFVSKFMDSNF